MLQSCAKVLKQSQLDEISLDVKKIFKKSTIEAQIETFKISTFRNGQFSVRETISRHHKIYAIADGRRSIFGPFFWMIPDFSA